MAMTGHGWRVQKPTVRKTADISMLYPPLPERFNPTCFEPDGTIFLDGIFPLSSVSRGEVRRSPTL
jgi:hypothetical protein